MTVLLYDNPVSGNCYKAQLIHDLPGIEFERRELSVVDHSDRAEVLGGLPRRFLFGVLTGLGSSVVAGHDGDGEDVECGAGGVSSKPTENQMRNVLRR